MGEGSFPSVVLSDERAELQATFLPTAGMLCRSLRHHGQELLAQNAGATAYAQRGKTMGIPLLYPWANRLAGFDYEVAGRAVAVPHDTSIVSVDGNGLPIHGVIGGRLPWELLPAPGAGGNSLAARVDWSESTPRLFEVFPFRHELRYEARLGQGRLEIEVTVHACSEDPVPVAFGFHPYLSPPAVPREGWLVELPGMRPLALDPMQIPTAPQAPQPPRRFELAAHEFDDGFDSVAEPAAFSVTAGPLRLGLAFTEGYPCAQVFAPEGKQFLCFEPMTAPANALRSGMGLRVLAPGERYHAGFAITVDEPS